MNILILDSGVYTNHPMLKGAAVDGYGLLYDKDQDTCIYVSDFEDTIGHGTAVYSLIRRNCDCANLKVVKIFDTDLHLSEEALIKILTYVGEHEKPDLLNLSLGISCCNNVHGLYEACRKIKENGTIIISAFDNAGGISYPAAFDCVYGVSGLSEGIKPKEIAYIQDSYVNLCIKETAYRLAWKNPDYIFLAANSFSCAMVTAMLAAKLHHQEIDMAGLPVIGEKMAAYHEIPFSIKKAAIFPINKEMHSLVRFAHLLSFELVDIFDHKYTGHVGARVKNIVNLKEDKEEQFTKNKEIITDKLIKDIATIDWAQIDTLILGHIDDLARLTGDFTLREKIIFSAKQHKVNIYAFDPCDSSDDVFSIQITEKNLPANHFNKLFKIAKPVLGVFGTSSRQGKFTLQLTIKELLEKEGYQIGQLGTEPSSLLFGMDEIFPYGYNAKITISEAESILYLNRLMNHISSGQCDLIIVGAQSATVPYGLDNIGQFIPYQHAFICGTNPDAAILMISPHDCIDYIGRSISYIESVSQGKVIALCMFPKFIESSIVGFYEHYKPLSMEELNTQKQYLSDKLNMNTYILGVEEDMKELMGKIIDFF